MPLSPQKYAKCLAMPWTPTARRVLAGTFAAIALAVGVLAIMPALEGAPAEGSQGVCGVTDLGALGAEGDSELRADGRWTTGNCDSRFRTDSDAHTYRFEVVEGGRIRIDLASDEGDSYLYLLTEDGVRITDNDDGGAGLDARIERDLAPGVYIVEATTVGGRVRGPGDFSLTVSRAAGCEPTPLGSLESDMDLTASGSWTIDTCGSRFVVEHPAHSYLFDMPQGGRVRIDLVSENGDPVMSLVSISRGLIIAANDDGGEGRNSRIDRYLQPGTYLIEATTYLERDYQPLMADFDLVVHLVDEEEEWSSSLLKIEEVVTPERVVAGQPFEVHYRVGNLGGGDLSEVGGTATIYVVGPRVYERRGPIDASDERWGAGVSYHTGQQTASGVSASVAEVEAIEVTLRSPGPSWVFVEVIADDESGEEVSFHGLWQNVMVLSGTVFDAVTVSVDGADHEVAAVADDEGMVTTTVSAVADPGADVESSVRARAIYAAGVHTQMLEGILERPEIAGLAVSETSEPTFVENPSTSALSRQFAGAYTSAVEASGLAGTIAEGEAINPVAVEDLVLDVARSASAQFVWLRTAWIALDGRISGGELLSVENALRVHSELAYAERVISPAAEAGRIVEAARDADMGWQDAGVQAMVDGFASRAACGRGTAGLRTVLGEVETTDLGGLLALDREMSAALPIYGLARSAILCALGDADVDNSLFLAGLDIADSSEVQGLLGRELPSVTPPSPRLQRLRIIARLTDDGRIEHGVELPGGEQILPASRFVSIGDPTGRWQASSDVEADGNSLGRIRSRMLDDGRIELGFRDASGEAITPDIRYLPAELPAGTWLRSAQIGVLPQPIPTPPITPEPDPRGSIVGQLRSNAEEFEYTTGEHGGTLTFATISEPLTFNLAISNDASSSGVLGYLFEGLTETSWLTDQVEPSLAESWEHSEDGLTWTFHLRRDVKWHDGEPFTAHDVEFTFNRIIYNHDIPASSRPTFHFRFLNEETGEWEESPMTVRALDDYTVECVLPVPFATFLRSMGTAIYPRHVLESHVDDGTFTTTWDINTDPVEVIGTGAFTIESYVPGERVVFVRNPDYWLKDDDGNSLPYLDRVVHVIVPELEDELEKFLEGEADVHGVLGEELAELEPLQEEKNFTIYRRGPAFGTSFVAFNMNPGSNPDTGEPYLPSHKLEWFRNQEFRQAVAYAIDKDRIIDEAQHGEGYAQWSSVSPAAGEFHNPNVRRYEYDLDRANEILDGLGWLDTDGDGIREDGEGNEIEFSMVTNAGNSVRETVGEIVHEGMTQIGLKVDYRVIEFGQLVDQLTETFDWEATVIGLTGGTDPHSGITVWHSAEGLHLWYPNQPEPATEWEAELDEIYITASQELDRDSRVELYHRAQEIVAENLPLIYTTLSERLSAVRNVFGNTTPTLYGLYDVRYLYRTDQ